MFRAPNLNAAQARYLRMFDVPVPNAVAVDSEKLDPRILSARLRSEPHRTLEMLDPRDYGGVLGQQRGLVPLARLAIEEHAATSRSIFLPTHARILQATRLFQKRCCDRTTQVCADTEADSQRSSSPKPSGFGAPVV